MISKAKKYFSKQKDISTAYVFGSYASGRVRIGSDLDIGIVFSQKPESFRRQSGIIFQLQKIFGVTKVDVRELGLSNSPVFLLSAIKNAKIIYEKNPFERQKFETEIMKEYIDTQKLRNIQFNYLKERIKEAAYAS